MPGHILLIQEDPTGAQVVHEALMASPDGPFQIEWVRSCSQGLERLRAQCTPE